MRNIFIYVYLLSFPGCDPTESWECLRSLSCTRGNPAVAAHVSARIRGICANGYPTTSFPESIATLSPFGPIEG